MYNGDIYVTLSHLNAGGQTDGFAVLLNRVGTRSGDPFGYADNGFQIEFRDDALRGNVHTYRISLGGNPSASLTGPLTGTWRPDGRTQDPSFVLDTDPVVTHLTSFANVNPGEGKWILFSADLFGGKTAQLDSWGLTFGAVAVPESQSYSLATGLLILLVARKRFHKM